MPGRNRQHVPALRAQQPVGSQPAAQPSSFGSATCPHCPAPPRSYHASNQDPLASPGYTSLLHACLSSTPLPVHKAFSSHHFCIHFSCTRPQSSNSMPQRTTLTAPSLLPASSACPLPTAPSLATDPSHVPSKHRSHRSHLLLSIRLSLCSLCCSLGPASGLGLPPIHHVNHAQSNLAQPRPAEWLQQYLECMSVPLGM